MLRMMVVLVGLFLAAPAWAHPMGPNASYVVEVEDLQGRSLRTFHRGGKTFVLGDYGARYNIRVRNRTGRRVEAVVTVDGRDVISGREGDYVNERGYILEPHGAVLIEGFRTSMESVAAFRFTNPANSYSSRMGTPHNVGVIGVAVFPERVRRVDRPRYRLPHERSQRSRKRSLGNDATLDGLGSGAPQAAPTPEAKGEAASASGSSPRARRAPPRNNLGTEYGEHRHSRVRETRFVRAHRAAPAALITLRYDDERGLAARGIRVRPIRPARPAYAGPAAFPRNRFAPPPP